MKLPAKFQNKKPNLGAFGSSFDHTTSSCLGFFPDKFRWVFNEVPESGVAVYMDHDILGGRSSHAEFKYLWLAESREVVPHAYNLVRNNFASLRDIYRRIFTHDMSLLQLSNFFSYVPNGSNSTWIKDLNQNEKIALLSIIDSGKRLTSGHLLREQLNNIVCSSGIEVECYGQKYGRHINRKEEALNSFMFSLVVENSIYDAYFTEKLLDCFAARVIPIYFGTHTADIAFNGKGILRCEPSSLADLLSTLTPSLYWSLSDVIEDNFYRVLKHSRADNWIYDKIFADLILSGESPPI